MTLNIPNLNKLITHLEAQPPERFDMIHYFSCDGNPFLGSFHKLKEHECGTAACIAGHIFLINTEMDIWSSDAAEWLGLSYADQQKLFEPIGFANSARWPLWRATATLKRLRDHYLATGEVVVDWGPESGSEPAQSWSPPKIVEQTLPVEITRLLGPEAVETVEAQ